MRPTQSCIPQMTLTTRLEDTMHPSICRCPKCRAVRAAALEAQPFEYGFAGTASTELEYPLSEAEEVELAMELMSVTSEAEMDQFLGKMFRSIGRGLKKVGRFVGGKILMPLGTVLKSVEKKALPFVCKALGSFIPIPGVGTAIGGALGSAVAQALELEFGELELEEAEFEMARRFVRIAATAAQQAASAPDTIDTETAIDEALIAAARNHLPGAGLSELESKFGGARGVTPRISGRWVRRGRGIMVLDA